MTVDLKRNVKYNEKKTRSVAAVEFDYSMIEDTTAHKVFELPPDALIVSSYFVVDTPAQTGVVVDIGFNGGDELFDGIDIDGTPDTEVFEARTIDGVGAGTTPEIAVTGSSVGPNLLTGTGKTVTVKFGTKPTAGVFKLIVEYIEYKLSNGQLMNY